MFLLEKTQKPQTGLLCLVNSIVRLSYGYPMLSFRSGVKDKSHKMNGLLCLSIDQSSPLLKTEVFSALKQESKGIVACRFDGDSLLCSSKNCSFLVIPISLIIPYSFQNSTIRLSLNRWQGRGDSNPQDFFWREAV